MPNLKNSEVLGNVFRAIFSVASRRTTEGFAATVIGAIVKTMEQNYDFLKYVYIAEGDFSSGNVIDVSSEIDTVDQKEIGQAIEAIIRIVYMDLVGKTGLFFIKELKETAGEEIINEMKNFGVDLALLQTEQRYLHRQQKRKKQTASAGTGESKKPTGDVSLLGYTWKNVASWEYDPGQRVCVLYNKDGRILDRLNIETIIENYVTNLSGEEEEIPENYKEEIHIGDKETELLKMLYSRDIDAETAVVLLHISKDEFESMIRHLLKSEMLQYVSYNEIELTEMGIKYLNDKEGEKKKEVVVQQE